MQILTRCPSEGLVIGSKVQVTVLEVEPDRVQLGITDPDSIPSYRVETIYLGDDDADQDGYQTQVELPEFEFTASLS